MKPFVTIILLSFTIALSAQMPSTLTDAEKVYGLSKFWQEANYNFVYFNRIDGKAWEATYKDYITKVQQTENDYEYYRLLQKFCAMLKDGHTNVYFPRAVQDSLYNTYFGDYRLFMTNIDGKAIVTRINESKKEEIPIGTEVISVNGQKTEQYLREQVMPYIASSTDYILEDVAVSRMQSRLHVPSYKAWG